MGCFHTQFLAAREGLIGPAGIAGVAVDRTETGGQIRQQLCTATSSCGGAARAQKTARGDYGAYREDDGRGCAPGPPLAPTPHRTMEWLLLNGAGRQ